MKQLIIVLPIIFLAACASKPPKKILIVPAIEPSHFVRRPALVRTPEQIKQYQFGRYVDPADRFVMHENHPVFRIERSAGWNLRPNPGDLPTAASAPSAKAPTESSDAVVAEINKQKVATKAFTAQVSTLNQRLEALSGALDQTEKVAAENLLLQQGMGTLRKRLDALENKSRDITAQSPPKPSPSPEQDW